MLDDLVLHVSVLSIHQRVRADARQLRIRADGPAPKIMRQCRRQDLNLHAP